jgi:hypothetical protein
MWGRGRSRKKGRKKYNLEWFGIFIGKAYNMIMNDSDVSTIVTHRTWIVDGACFHGAYTITTAANKLCYTCISIMIIHGMPLHPHTFE